MSSKGEHQTVPLSVLLKRELANEKIENPEICHGQASQSKKGEDFTFVKTECQRVVGDEVFTYSVFAIGPLRCWPGGLCLSRSIGDLDVGEYIVPVPYVKQVKLSTAGGRLIISSDGVWDALSAETAFDCCRGMPPDAAASQIVKDAVGMKGLRDDTTCIVIDVRLPEKPNVPLPPPKKQGGKGVFMSMFRKKSSESSSQIDKEYCEPDVVEEIFEDGSAMLSERLDTKYPICNVFKLFMCAVCQVEMKPGEGISIYAGISNSGKVRPWDGPFLCVSCQEKKEAMEGKRPSGAGRYSSGSD
ncbi:putative protein phosphatase 2C 12 [Camellia lanceoleosa]|uniref:Uncharacterized protein n=1 Tax=Camellia lanceoleosa TaxID=1840588 RepID=A0ACC0HT69_9ERIC|nr:putative protein phosphatase 2C 12 [Camellia lanceoleosa]